MTKARDYACYDCSIPTPCLCPHAALYFSSLVLPAFCSCTFSIVIPTSFNILMTCCFNCQIHVTCEPHPLCSSRSREITCLIMRKWLSCIQKYMYSSSTRAGKVLRRFRSAKHSAGEYEAVSYKNEGKYLYRLEIGL